MSEETIEAFAKGLMVLRSFATHRRQTISEVANHVGITRAAARRYLRTLIAEHYAVTDGKHVELTPRVLELGHAYLAGVSELEAIRTVLQSLTRDIGEASSAAMLDEAEIVYVARSHARHRIMTIGLDVGTRLPAHATSMGQAILSQMSHNELERFFAVSRMEALTPKTITTKQALKERLKQVRERGFALVSEELELGLRSIAMPISGLGPGRRFAINLSTHAARIDEEGMIARFLPALREAAAQIALVTGART